MALEDLKRRKDYIFDTFKYPSLIEGFTNKIYKSLRILEYLPFSNVKTEFLYKGDRVYYKINKDNIIIYSVNKKEKTVHILRLLSVNMNWKIILENFVKKQ